MSKIALKPNDSGTGTFTLEAPNSNTNRTLSLPDEAGTVLTDTSDIETQVKTATNATGSAPVYACRAWVNFDGTGTVSIRDSGNVTSIADRGTGKYTVNFATPMPDLNYGVATAGSDDDAANAIHAFNIDESSSITTSSIPLANSFVNASTNRTFLDVPYLNVAIFR